MLFVHGSFVPYSTSGFFFLWAMASPEGDGEVQWRSSGRHPLVAPPEHLYPVICGIPYANAVDCLVHMPHPRGLVPAKVAGLALSTGSAAQWLLDLEDAFESLPLSPGRSLRVWSAAAKLLLELLARGRILPRLRAEAGSLVAGWDLAAPEAADTSRLDQLAAALPGVCRAIVPPERSADAYAPPPARSLLVQFWQAAAGALVPTFLSGADLPHPEASPGPAQNWLLGLTGLSRAELPPGLPAAERLHAAVEAWAAPALGTLGAGSLRTGLRLHPPRGGDWELELTLQTSGDPPLAVPAAAAWDAVGGKVSIGEQVYQGAEQRVLADLPAMARLCPLLLPLCSMAAPSSLTFDIVAVLEFLESGAPALQEAGFPVLLPAELVRPARVRARMHLSPDQTEESPFGLNQLVKVDWELALGETPITYEELQHLARQKRPLVQLGGRWVLLDPRTLAAALRQVEPNRERISLAAALRLEAQSQAGPGDAQALAVEAAAAEGWVAELLERLRAPARVKPVPTPAGLQGTLRPYQERGFAWLAFLRRFGLGACLADDMGLGKTVQVIALLLHEREQGWARTPTLIVCPVSLVGNWRRELARFAPSLRVLVHHGAGRTAAAKLAEAAAQHDVVITTYSLLGRDEEGLAAVPWAGVVADEAQNLKNPETIQARAIGRLPSGYRIGLTGTPVENHLGDLWSLFAFLNPGLLGGQEQFRRHFALPIERFRDATATARLRRLVQPLLLRRLKTDPAIISDLPEKVEMTVYANLTVEQAALYEAVVQETLQQAANRQGIERRGAVLAGLTRLKQVCNHPTAVAGDSGDLSGRSGKLERLAEMLQEALAEGDRALVFTQFAAFGRRLHEYLARRLACPVFVLDGSTPQAERDRLVQRFQAGEAPVFVLSLRAGGLGLNLTAANRVFHFDQWWNPAVEDQATDRSHRIGQNRQVLVHKLVTAGTLEERIDRLLADKRTLSDQVIGAGESWLGELSTEELRSLIRLERE